MLNISHLDAKVVVFGMAGIQAFVYLKYFKWELMTENKAEDPIKKKLKKTSVQ